MPAFSQQSGSDGHAPQALPRSDITQLDGARVDNADHVMVAAGRIDQLLKVECRDNDEVPALINDVIRAIPGVRAHRDVHLPTPREAVSRPGFRGEPPWNPGALHSAVAGVQCVAARRRPTT